MVVHLPGMTAEQRRELKEKFEHALKLTAENKITRSNAFDENFGQIMRHLPELIIDATQDTNFQKASSGLDTGVRIYDKRVDATWIEVHQTLGLMPDDGADDQEGAGGQPAGKEPKRAKTAANASATLASAEALMEKKQDAGTFESDPLFCRTSKLFDKHSTAALLLLNYPVHWRTHILFDGDERPFANLPAGLGQHEGEPDVQLDLSHIRGLPELVHACGTQRITPSIQHLYEALQQAQCGRAVAPIQLDNTAILQRALGSKYVNPAAASQIPASSQRHSSMGEPDAAASQLGASMAATASLHDPTSQHQTGVSMDMDVDMKGPGDMADGFTANEDHGGVTDVLGSADYTAGDVAGGFDDDNDDAAWGAQSPVHVGFAAAAHGGNAGHGLTGSQSQDEEDVEEDGSDEDGPAPSTLLGVALPEASMDTATGKAKGRGAHWTIGSGIWRYRAQPATKTAAQAKRTKVASIMPLSHEMLRRKKEIAVTDWQAACLEVDEDKWDRMMAKGSKKTTKKPKAKPRAEYQPPAFKLEQLDRTFAGWSVVSALRTDLAAAAMQRRTSSAAAGTKAAAGPESWGTTPSHMQGPSTADADVDHDGGAAAGFGDDEPAYGLENATAVGTGADEGGYWGGSAPGSDDDAYGDAGPALLVDELEGPWQSSSLLAGSNMSLLDPLSVEALLPPARKTAHLQVTYDKSAKQVDIKALKDRMQQRLDVLCEQDDCAPAQDQDTEQDAAAEIAPAAGISLHKVLHQLPVEDVAGLDNTRSMSVHLAFISLLHLANEKGLQLHNHGRLGQLNILGWAAS